jgi:hypothetical protein
MDKRKISILMILFVVSSILLGCGGEDVVVSKKGLSVTTKERTTEPAQDTPEAVLVREIADGKLVEVYDEYVRMEPGGIEKNWMIINNVKEKDETFTVYPCGGCDFEERVFDVPAGEYKIIKFKVRAMEGQKDIKVKDSLNNAYGYAKISVIVE